MYIRALVLAVILAGMLVQPSSTDAQGPPPNPQGPPQGQRPPHPTGGANSGTHLPPEIRDAPYNGPSTKAPPGLQVPRNPQEAQQTARQLDANPAVAAAHQASRAAVAAQRALGQRLRGGQLPTEADRGLGRNIQPEPPRRSDDPTGLLRLLTVDAGPSAEPEAAPDAQGVPFFGGFLCFVWTYFFLDRDQWGDDYFGTQGLNYCFPPATNEAVLYQHVSMDVYKCGTYFITWDICIGEQHWYELWPSCEGFHVTYLWCGGGGQTPRAMYPQNLSGAYFARVTGHIQTLGGQVGQAYIDSEVIPYRCFQGLGVIC